MLQKKHEEEEEEHFTYGQRVGKEDKEKKEAKHILEALNCYFNVSCYSFTSQYFCWFLRFLGASLFCLTYVTANK